MTHLIGPRVVIADDHPVVLAGLVALLRQIDHLDVVAACLEGETALKMILELRPDIACLDVQMPKHTGFEVVAAARKAGSKTQFMLLTGSVSREDFTTASDCGAIAIFHKDSASDELLEWFEACDFKRDSRECGFRDGGDSPRNLTIREREIAMFVARGLSNKHIAREAGISEGTVKIHLYNIFQKLGIVNRTELANYANVRAGVRLQENRLRG
jgi:two-component system, NarL family, nitrate/nitrite response regulator NarL